MVNLRTAKGKILRCLTAAVASVTLASAAGTASAAPTGHKAPSFKGVVPPWAFPSATVPTPPPPPVTHVVASGDSFWSIANYFGLSMQQVAGFNRMTLQTVLMPGMTLIIPPASYVAPPMPPPTPVPQVPAVNVSVLSPSHASVVMSTVSASGYESCVIAHESGGNPTATNPSSGASGLYQFLPSTWQAVTGLPGVAADYPPSVQQAAFAKLYAEDGRSPWAGDGC